MVCDLCATIIFNCSLHKGKELYAKNNSKLVLHNMKNKYEYYCYA